MSFAAVGSVEQIRDLLCGPQQHDEHLRAHRWHLYVRDSERRWEAVKAELRRIHAERRARETIQLQAAE